MPTEALPGPAIPLARWADRQLALLRDECRSPALAEVGGATLLGERAQANRFAIPGLVSSGGGCRLLPARDGWLALNLARFDDRDLLPALFGRSDFSPHDDTAVAALVAASPVADLLEQGRLLGLALASADETPALPPVMVLTEGYAADRTARTRPLVLDLSALWAGPLAAHLLWLAGADVVKVESPTRLDGMRAGDPRHFALLNQGKASVTLDFRAPDGRAALLRLIERADIVIEAARPRALAQLGIDASALVGARPGLTWITITGHGATGAQGEWVGFGDDCSVAGGLSAALARASGEMGFGGDAVADPLTGIVAALEAWRAWRRGRSCRIALSMSGIVATALADERARAPSALAADLRDWAAARGQPFPPVAWRIPAADVQPPGAANAQWLSPC